MRPLLLAGAALLYLTVSATAQAGQQPSPPTVPGPTNTIGDVPGLKVGHYQQFGGGYRSGTTVILTERGATTGYSQLGGAPGSKETDLLTPGGLVTEVHAVVLSGGSAFGLDASSGVMRWLEERGHGYAIAGGVVPIVPAAILMDLGRGGDFGKRPDAEFGYRAAEAASGSSGATAQGRVGAGTGAGWGLGTASVRLANGYTVGAIVGLNPGGSPVDPSTCLPYAMFLELGSEFNLVAPHATECPGRLGTAMAVGEGGYENAFNTTIALVATDAPLNQTQAQRMAMIANSGLSRSIRPVHNLGDGDLVFGMATTTPPSNELSNRELHDIYNAAADALGRAVVHSILRSEQMGNSRPGYCQQYPSACRLRGAR